MRSLKKSIFSIGLFSNRQVNIACLISLAMLLAVVYLPKIRDLFEFRALSIQGLLLLVLISFSIIVAGETIKLLHRFKPII